MRVLITGGAGFIGSFIADELISRGYEVRIYDNLESQVHPDGKIPDYLNKKVEFIKGDVRDIESLRQAIKNCSAVLHKAASVGVAQSQYQIRKYIEVNELGTANLLQILADGNHNIKKLIIAASMSSYGEGYYKCISCGVVDPGLRPIEQMEKGDWELHCPKCNKNVVPIPTSETKPFKANSIYAISKQNQEEMCLNIGRTYDIPTVALRYFNVYGPRQSLSNPYTGVTAIFMSRIKNDNPPVVYEDGNQTRDFISVYDIARANAMALESDKANYEIFNVGSSNPLKIKEIAFSLANLLGKNIEPDIVGKFRKGDVRHCYADITKIKKIIGWEPKISFEEGMVDLINWSKTVEAVDKFDLAVKEMKEKGLI